MKVVLSSAHGKKVRGAKDLIDEVDESRRLVAQLADDLAVLGVVVATFDDDTSTSKMGNLKTIVAAHNRQSRDLDVSVHFNMATKTSEPRGTEVLYRSADMLTLAKRVANAIANVSGLINRGAKHRTNLAFLRQATKPAILIEICFVDSAADVRIYQQRFDAICKAIAEAIAGRPVEAAAQAGAAS